MILPTWDQTPLAFLKEKITEEQKQRYMFITGFIAAMRIETSVREDEIEWRIRAYEIYIDYLMLNENKS